MKLNDRMRWIVSTVLLIACIGVTAVAQQAPDKDDEMIEPPAPKVTGRGSTMDYGPFLSYSVTRPRTDVGVKSKPAAKPASAEPKVKGKPKEEPVVTQNIGYQEVDLLAAKGITIHVGKDACVCFDTDLLRMAAGWSGGFLDLAKTNLGGLKGSSPAAVHGTLAFTTKAAPGWTTSDFTDPRDGAQGPLPRDTAHYKGLYRNGDKIVLAYSIGATNVLELPGSITVGDVVGFTRTFHIDRSDAPLKLLVADVDGATVDRHDPSLVTLVGKDATTAATLIHAPDGAALQVVDGSRIVLNLPALAAPVTFRVLLCSAPTAHLHVQELTGAANEVEDLPSLCNGGPAIWKEKIVTTGVRSPDNAAYVVDTIRLPEENPWHSWIRPGGFDFFLDGRAAVCTMSGDVWIVSGIDDKLDHVVWKRYASGLYEPLGLKIVEDVIYVTGRDRITCLRDLNNDGEADFYENFNSDCVTSPIYHAFAFDLQTDKAGNFYYVRDGNQVPHSTREHGCVFKISPDGTQTEIFATGFRAANGLGMSPDGQLVSGDNQGHWTPSSRINLVKDGGYYGYPGDPRRVTKADMQKTVDAELRRYPAGYDLPICWVPYSWDNSSGGQVSAGDKWGPFSGRLLHTSYGKCTLFEVMSEIVDGQIQGGVVVFPFKFESGVMRGRISPVDGQVYLCGLKGWQTSSGKDGCFQRVRYTGKPAYMPESLHVTNAGIHIGFTCELDPATAGDEGSYAVEQFTYHYASQYGSKEYKVSDPTKAGHDTVEIKSVKLSPDRKSVLLVIPGLKPVMQMEIKMDIKSADGQHIKCEIGNTINKVGAEGGA